MSHSPKPTRETSSDPLARLQNGMAHAQKAMAWLLIGTGAATLLANLGMLYFLATGQVRPGEPYFLDGLAPTRWQTVSAGFTGLASLLFGLGMRSLLAQEAETPRRPGERRALKHVA